MPAHACQVVAGVPGQRLALSGQPGWWCRPTQMSNALLREFGCIGVRVKVSIAVGWGACQAVSCGADAVHSNAVAKCLPVSDQAHVGRMSCCAVSVAAYRCHLLWHDMCTWSEVWACSMILTCIVNRHITLWQVNYSRLKQALQMFQPVAPNSSGMQCR